MLLAEKPSSFFTCVHLARITSSAARLIVHIDFTETNLMKKDHSAAAPHGRCFGGRKQNVDTMVHISQETVKRERDVLGSGLSRQMTVVAADHFFL